MLHAVAAALAQCFPLPVVRMGLSSQWPSPSALVLVRRDSRSDQVGSSVVCSARIWASIALQRGNALRTSRMRTWSLQCAAWLGAPILWSLVPTANEESSARSPSANQRSAKTFESELWFSILADSVPGTAPTARRRREADIRACSRRGCDAARAASCGDSAAGCAKQPSVTGHHTNEVACVRSNADRKKHGGFSGLKMAHPLPCDVEPDAVVTKARQEPLRFGTKRDVVPQPDYNLHARAEDAPNAAALEIPRGLRSPWGGP